MFSPRFRFACGDQQGVALPLALLVLALLTSLTLAFLALSSTEPTIAANLKGGEVALALAEAGIERGVWGIGNPTAAAGLATPLPNPVPAPYNGQQLVALGSRAFTIAVTQGPGGPDDRIFNAHGYVLREGVAVPAQIGNLAQSDIAAHRWVRLQVT